MADSASRIAENLAEVRERMAAAARRAGREPQQVRLVAVTKYVGLEEIRALVAAGCADLGESRPQDFWPKATQLADLQVAWHFVGHLQRNKVARTVPLVHLLHSADSPRLLTEVDSAVASSGRSPLDVLLEVNISAHPRKHGFTPDELQASLASVAILDHVRVRGLMAMAGEASDDAVARRDFAALRELRDRLRGECPLAISLDELSMGMSGDYEIAIEEGATLVRVGSALFEGVR